MRMTPQRPQDLKLAIDGTIMNENLRDALDNIFTRCQGAKFMEEDGWLLYLF